MKPEIMKKKAIYSVVGAVVILAAAGGTAWLLKRGAEPPVRGGPPTARLISSDQYAHAIAYVFGPDVKVPGSFPPVQRTNGLVALGTAQAVVTSSAAELYVDSARRIAAQATDPARRDFLMNCAPAKPPEDTCARNVLARYGRLLFRRPLTDAELAETLERARETTRVTGDFYQGLASGLTSLLISPEFLFFIERTEPDPDSPTHLRLDASSMATRLSLLLWDAPPDEELLEASEKGDLYTKRGLARQVDRMLASSKLEQGVRSFLVDMLVFEKFDSMTKDPVIYPAFTDKVSADSREQTLRTLVDHLVVRDLDYRDIFTTRRTFVTGDLGMVYRIPVERPDAWTPYEFPADSGRAGVLTQPSFLALYSHPGRSSPTVRGRAMREVFLCQVVPTPPPDVDFSKFEAAATTATTARERLTAHRKNPACAGCHKIMDPIGLALEKFDGSGTAREMENGLPIDASGELDNASFTDAVGLGKAMHDDPAATKCLVSRVFDYARGYKATSADNAWLNRLNEKFAESGYRLPALLREIATSKAFYAVSAPAAEAAPGTPTIRTASAR
jgi:hypothetical protein